MNYPYQNGPQQPTMTPGIPPNVYGYHPYPHPPPQHYVPVPVQDMHGYPHPMPVYQHPHYPPHLAAYPPPHAPYNHTMAPAARFHQQHIPRNYSPRPPINHQQYSQPQPHPVVLSRPPSLPPPQEQRVISSQAQSETNQPTVPQNQASLEPSTPVPITSTEKPIATQTQTQAMPDTPSQASEPPSEPSKSIPELKEERAPPKQLILTPPASGPSSPVTVPINPPTLPPPRIETVLYHVAQRRPKISDVTQHLIFALSASPPTALVDKAIPLPKPKPTLTPKKKAQPSSAPVVSASTKLSRYSPAPTARPNPANPVPVRLPSVSQGPSVSSSVTETTPATSIAHTPTPGSPISSHTSVSSIATPSAAKHTKSTSISPSVSKVPVPPTVVEEQVVSDSNKQSAAETTAPVVAANSAKPNKPAAWSTGSFASRLRSQNEGSGGSGKSVVRSLQTGFSIPGNLSIDTSLTPKQHSNLLQLLATGTILNSPSAVTLSQIQPRGLVNIGNMCFANAVLQVLVYTSPFWKLFSDLGDYIGNGPVVGSGKKDGKGTPLTDATIAFLNEFKPPKLSEAALKGSDKTPTTRRDSFVPSGFYAALKTKSRFDAMQKGHQEDAEEFLGFLLDTLHEELLTLTSQFGGKPVTSVQEDALPAPAEEDDDQWQEVGKKNRPMVTRTNKSLESAITAIFGGQFRSVLRASGRPDSASVEQWRCLPLDIQPLHIKTIEDALYNIGAPETVSVQSARHTGSIDATKQMFIEALPPVLILHVKRFVYDPVTGIGKNGKAVSFGSELDIRTDLMSATLRQGGPAKYKLYGVIYHHGLSATGGHYTLDVLHPNPGAVQANSKNVPAPPNTPGWVRFDDEYVRRLKPEEVFGKGPVEDRVAYLLFYKRVQPGRS